MKKIFDKIDTLSKEFDENYQQRKIKFKEWLKKEYDFQFPNWIKVVLSGLLSFLLFRIFYEIDINPQKEKPNAFWTLATLIISSPVAFIIWHFRDQNATKQIENQRKDINLKEFQKIAEWVSGLHLIEDEITEKSSTKDSKKELETSTKYTQQNSAQSIPTFNKRDGAVGLQIAAIHSLLPFFQGKHGDDFRRPALNLLTSAWLSLQQKDLAILDTIDVLESPDEFDKRIDKIQNNAKSPIGVALTQVLLSDGGKHLLKFPEVFPNLCLAGMDFHLPGLDKRVLSLFFKAKNCQGINLIGSNLSNSNLSRTQLEQSSLINTNLKNAVLKNAIVNNANLSNAQLEKADFANAELNSSILVGADLKKTNLSNSSLGYADLTRANLSYSNLNKANLTRSDLTKADLQHADLNQSSLMRATLKDARLYSAKLNRANLAKADLTNAMLSFAELIGANLRQAIFQECNLDNANLEGVNLTNTQSLNGTTFSDAITTGACLNEAQTTEIRDFNRNNIFILFSSKPNSQSINIGSWYLSIRNKKTQRNYRHHLDTSKQFLDLEKTRQDNPDWEITIE